MLIQFGSHYRQNEKAKEKRAKELISRLEFKRNLKRSASFNATIDRPGAQYVFEFNYFRARTRENTWGTLRSFADERCQ